MSEIVYNDSFGLLVLEYIYCSLAQSMVAGSPGQQLRMANKANHRCIHYMFPIGVAGGPQSTAGRVARMSVHCGRNQRWMIRFYHRLVSPGAEQGSHPVRLTRGYDNVCNHVMSLPRRRSTDGPYRQSYGSIGLA